VFYRIAMDHHRLSRRVRALLGRWATDEVGTTADLSTELSVWAAVDRLPVRQRATLPALPRRLVLRASRVSDGASPPVRRAHTRVAASRRSDDG
jgi:hypothetical protein